MCGSGLSANGDGTQSVDNREVIKRQKRQVIANDVW
jgi:hypothetical protein